MEKSAVVAVGGRVHGVRMDAPANRVVPFPIWNTKHTLSNDVVMADNINLF